jgi:hypothetical protein
MDRRALPLNLLHPLGQGGHRQIHPGREKKMRSSSRLGPSLTRHFFLWTEKGVGAILTEYPKPSLLPQ